MIIQKTMNLSIPAWCTEEIYYDLRELFVIRAKAEEATQELKKIHAGPLLKEFLDNINDPDHKKAYFYSGHDLNIGSIVETLQIQNFDFPDFGCALILETWQDKMNEHIKFVKVSNKSKYSEVSSSEILIVSGAWLAGNRQRHNSSKNTIL